MPAPSATAKQPYVTPLTLKLIDQRNDAERRGRPADAKRLQKAVKKNVRRDKERYLHDCLKTGEWKAVTKERKHFEPRTTRLRDPGGKMVGTQHIAETQAQHYATHQWNAPENLPPRPPRPALFATSTEIEVGPFSLGDLLNAIRKLKSKKAPGPDGIPNEIWKTLLKCANPKKRSSIRKRQS